MAGRLQEVDIMWRRQQVSLRQGLPLLVLAAGLLVTGLTALYFLRNTNDTDRARFNNDVERLVSSVEAEKETYMALLQASRGFFYANRNATPDDFATYIRYQNLRQRYPGLQGLGFIWRVAPENLSTMTRALQEAGEPGFQVTPPGNRPEYHIVAMIEPRDDRNRAALGYDMFTEPVRRTAMERARDEGAAIASGKVLLRQEIDEQTKQNGFLIYLPVYDYTEADEPQNVAARREALTGFVYCPLRAGDFFNTTLGTDLLRKHRVEVFAGAGSAHETLIYESVPASAEPARYTTERLTNFAGRAWNIRVTSLPAFNHDSRRNWTPVIVASGSAFSFLLFALFLSQARAREAAESRARALRAAQRAQQERLATEQTARQTAEEANRAKDEFLAVVSHELRTPLNAIVGWARMLRAGALKPEGLTRAVAVIERNAQTQLRLTEDLLDFAGLHARQLKLHRQNVAVEDVVAAALATVQPLAEAKNVRLVEDTAPQAGAINVDAARIQQVLWNLLANAIKFTPSGGEVALLSRRHGQEIEFVVSDTGEGIEKDFLPHVFERFRQEDATTTRHAGGLGLGLAIVSNLVELHGGSVSVDSPGKGQGTRFTVRLPLTPPPVAGEEETM